MAAADKLGRQLVAEAIGTGFLVAAVVGSGIMADRLTADTAMALMGNTIPTGAILFVLITLLGPVSGAHFNPAVTLAFALGGDMSRNVALRYVLAQICGGISGAVLAHAMFDLPLLQISQTDRGGADQFLSEIVATFGLVATIFAGLRTSPQAIPALVGLYITAAYWFTASTSFANPAVTIARGLTDTFSGISPGNILIFIVAQVIGAAVAVPCCRWLFRERQTA
ncbi:MIP/aquaporin family protein [Paracoccus xiamenensis]|uniref:MIP/aquaporin family protein n=1 Tax=Paracoccus xiamenensis TaxID=2714901 RepID=UPI002E2B276C|nr:MIP/aquaporin family protein [Paracoccus xiamenensis]